VSRGGVVAPCNIVAAGRGQCKVEVAAEKNRKKVTINRGAAA